MQARAFRIGSGAGYAGDRIEPVAALAAQGRLDALVFECLAERTIALAQLRRAHDPEHGYDPLLQERLHAVLPACVAAGTVVISNMGAANPLAAGRAAAAVARERGLRGLKLAVVTGDDVLPWLRAHPQPHWPPKAGWTPCPAARPAPPTWATGCCRPMPTWAPMPCCRRWPPAPTWCSPAAWPTRRCSWRR